MKEIIKDMLNVKKFTDIGTVYWLILFKTIIGILMIIYSDR